VSQVVHAKPPTTRAVSTAPTGPLPSGQLVILVALTFWLYGSTLTHLVKQWWHDPNFSHGFFVPAFSAFVVWQRRSHLAQIPLEPSWTGAGIVAVCVTSLIKPGSWGVIFRRVRVEPCCRLRAALFPMDPIEADQPHVTTRPTRSGSRCSSSGRCW